LYKKDGVGLGRRRDYLRYLHGGDPVREKRGGPKNARRRKVSRTDKRDHFEKGEAGRNGLLERKDRTNFKTIPGRH